MKPKGLAFRPAGSTDLFQIHEPAREKECVCVCVRVCVCLWSSDEGPEPQGGWRVGHSALRMTLRCYPQAVTCSSAFLLGRAPPTMQFFKSSLILLFASPVVFCHGGDLGLAPGVSSSPVQARPSGGGQVPFLASPAPAPSSTAPLTTSPTPAFPHP